VVIWRRRRGPSRIILEQLTERRGARVMIVFVGINLSIALVSLSQLFGYSSGREQSRYQIVQDGPYKGYAIVWQSSPDIFVLQRYVPRLKLLSYETTVIRLDRDQTITWHWVKTGPLDDVYSLWRSAGDYL
jgi:hypothetical protein